MKEFECNSKKSTLGPFHLGDEKIHKNQYPASLLECNDLIWDAGQPDQVYLYIYHSYLKTIFSIYNLNKKKSFPWEMKRAKT